MIFEIERQKCNRTLEKAQKALSDAMWKKKKQKDQENIDSGISFLPSSISEGPIFHSDEKTVATANDIYKTSYNRLARDQVVDLLEQPPTLKTIPHTQHAKLDHAIPSMDKYTFKYTNRMLLNSIKSWEEQEGSLISSTMKTSALMSPDRSKSLTFRKHSTSSDMSLGSTNDSVASQRVGSLLQTRTNDDLITLSSKLRTLGDLRAMSKRPNYKTVTSLGSVRRKEANRSVRLKPLSSSASSRRGDAHSLGGLSNQFTSSLSTLSHSTYQDRRGHKGGLH